MIRRTFRILLLLCLCWTTRAFAATWSLTSPDGTLTVVVQSSDNQVSYLVRRGPKVVIGMSSLGVTLAGDGGDLSRDLTFVRQSDTRINDTFTLLAGKRRLCVNQANEKTLVFQNAAGRQMEVIFRAYNDGIAFRYRLPGTGAATLTGENSSFGIAGGSAGWVAKYNPNYEEFYPQGVVGHDWTNGDLGIPALFDVSGGQFVLLAESAVGGTFSASHLAGSADGTYHVKWADNTVAGTLPWATPWRVAIIGTLAAVVQSTLVDALAPPPIAGDTSWIKPGRAAWSWWSQDTGDLALQKHYVDFAHEMGWEYNLVDAGWPDWNNKNPGPQIEELVKYGAERGVGILLWAHHNELDTAEKRERLLPLWKSWGIKGVKIDFFDSDSQSTMAQREAILKTAWDNHLLVNLHGDQAPRGQNRTWPNFLTREGVRGAEYYKFGPYPTPEYNCTLPFTRNVLGPMDYTPVTFSTKNRKTTAGHELSLAVVFQSGWQHFADSPESYNSQPVAKEFLKQVPADWDETRLLAGYPAQFACIARRKGNDWFIGCNNASTPRSVALPLAFLSKGNYRLDLFQDGKAPDSIDRNQSTVKQGDVLRVNVPSNGGFAAHFAPVR